MGNDAAKIREYTLLACVMFGLGSQACHAGDPLQVNVRKLEARIQDRRPALVRSASAATRPRPRRVAVNLERTVRRRAARPPSAGRVPAASSAARIGSKPRAGDLVVRATGADSAVHVYLRQRLVSRSGNGQARVPDLAPGKYPVLLWAPDLGRRKICWVRIQPGAVASLQVTL
jgi:hypothetical protein